LLCTTITIILAFFFPTYNLTSKLDEVRSSERTLRSRVKSLTNELAILKRSIRSSPIPYRTPGTISGSGNRTRGSTRRTTGVRERQRSTSGDRRNNKYGGRRRSFSNERRIGQQKLRTPSPGTGGGRVPPRFDPTAFVEHKKQRQQEINTRLGYVCLRSRP
jgi:coiled-coil domain-containing protein 61